MDPSPYIDRKCVLLNMFRTISGGARHNEGKAPAGRQHVQKRQVVSITSGRLSFRNHTNKLHTLVVQMISGSWRILDLYYGGVSPRARAQSGHSLNYNIG